MIRDLVDISAEKSVFVAWKQMLEQRIKAMPVVDHLGRVIGILTDEDLLERAGIQQHLQLLYAWGMEIEQELTALELSAHKIKM
jgi:CBS-domain-containing membrane protein